MKREREPLAKAELDTITVAGSLKVLEVTRWSQHRHTTAFLNEAILLISNASHFIKKTGLTGCSPPATTHLRHNIALKKLCNWSVIRQSTGKKERFFGIFFEVPKATATTRAILNARIQNARANRPPSFALAQFSLVVSMMCTFSEFYVADLRHWFYQIRLPAGIEQYFSILCGSAIFEFLVLPMGFSWAPFIAQCLCMGLFMLTRFVHSAINCISPPPCVDFFQKSGHTTIGRALCIYDNILVGTSNSTILEQLVADIRGNAKQANIVFKEEQITRSPSFLGVVFTNSTDQVSWQHCSKNLERWSQRLDHPTSSNRDVAGLIGIILWDANVHLRPLCLEQRCIQMLRKIAGDIACVSSWNQFSKLLPEEITELRDRVRSITTLNTPSTRLRAVLQSPIWLVTDACRNDKYSGWGWLIVTENHISRVEKGQFSPSMALKPIFMLELWCALEAIRQVCLENVGTNLAISISIDNQAVAQALRKGYSSVEEANEWMVAALSPLQDGFNTLVVLQIRSEENPADGPHKRCVRVTPP
ncbi:transmembrane protein, putative [Bodo saltans]|uniref:Transmembrane protein, putative n=1 Tax=Bodo saltans TaxID=75058 RepID=A0A0S4ITM6_BODSA|nr:transmembrane protein, putative [Bodo saltans]|eukprot:CUF79501.1 transmembrane protein, putative [Bodo saltans]